MNHADFGARAARHLFVEHFAWWLDPEDVTEYFSIRNENFNSFSAAVLQVRLLLGDMNANGSMDRTLAFPCSGCTTPCEHEQRRYGSERQHYLLKHGTPEAIICTEPSTEPQL